MYKVSVVTPFHNVDMGMFQKCADGMRCQTIGFENIEWIIVVHNSKPHYFPLVTEMFKNDKNVIVKELNDDMHSPASPRNHGMQFVTSSYLGFLDADDSYTPDCLEVVRREMIETQSQVVTFRREYELEKESLHPHTEKVVWNQTEWRIVMDRKDFQLDKMFTGLWPFSTSRLFDVAFLRKHNLTFSDKVLWVEDVWHTGMCLMLADRVCYLPQFIGYHYFINSGSIIQDKKKPMEELIECFKSANIIIDDLSEMGVDITDTTNTLFTLLTQYYLASDLTVEQRRTLCDIARPYLEKLQKMSPSKIHTPEECYLSYHLSKEVLSNPEDPMASPMLKDAMNGWMDMMNILRNNASTDYGRHYHFDQVETLADYQRLVPMSDFENYKRLLDLQANIGESGILTTAPTRQYLVNAKEQLIPCTDDHLRPYMESFATTLKRHHNLLVAIVGPRKKQTNDGCTVETLESQMVKKYMWYYHYARGKCRATFSMPDDLFFKTEPKEEMHTICRYALLDRDIDQIVALDTRRVAEMFDYIIEHQEMLMTELRELDNVRADEVADAFRSGKPLAQALWHQLERVIAFGAGEYYDATTHMKQFTGQIPHNNGYYYTEETIYGRAVADDSDLFETLPSTGFHEYLPLEEDNATTVLPTNTKRGVPYQLVVTNNAGLYRYVTDHIVCIQETQLDKILFTIY
ncbi:GH3 auxin-responsive promoter family protein [Prevotella sp. tf2-5]|uniref:GH3 family domain-containing protein n=1 Tax=Prevotella sp. tf2-5 TaxID=1761889 RepID=UPI0008EE3E3C|nr:GH3 auxin-responsive promoter family protein [Prevotella sp. tf2-5]SFO91085.1 Glycosyl transferase family 2 [Prevotella sp. tf2-5]